MPPVPPGSSRRTVAISAAALAVVLTLSACGSPGPSGASSEAITASPTPPVTTQATTSAAPSSSTSAAPSTTRASSSPRATRSKRTGFTASPRTKQPPVSGSGGSVVVLNPGHNGGNGSHPGEINRLVPAGYGERKACDTTGTTTNAGYPEHAFTYDVAVRVRTILQARGLTVVMTRPNDIGVGPCVNERGAVGNRTNVAACVSIHADGAPSSGHGFHVNQASRRPDGASAAVARDSVRLGKAIHGTLQSSSGLTPSNYIGSDGYYYRSDLAGLNLARRPTTFLEIGNMRNAADAAKLSSSSGRARIARAVADGILAFLGR